MADIILPQAGWPIEGNGHVKNKQYSQRTGPVKQKQIYVTYSICVCLVKLVKMTPPMYNWQPDHFSLNVMLEYHCLLHMFLIEEPEVVAKIPHLAAECSLHYARALFQNCCLKFSERQLTNTQCIVDKRNV